MDGLLDTLEDDVRQRGLVLLSAAAREGLLLKITQGRRSLELQAQLYAQGRQQPGPIVTHAPPGYSWHNFGRAFDVALQGPDPYPDDPDLWEKIGNLGEQCGLEWGGRWKHPDWPHFEHHGGRTLALARAQARDQGLLA